MQMMASITYSRPSVAAQPRIVSLRGQSRSGIWVGIFAITMSFAAFTSALYVRQGSGDWVHIVLPPIVYANTLGLLLSSLTLELARRATPRDSVSPVIASSQTVAWLLLTLALGLAFVAGQYLAWRHLAAQGLYLATNSNSSFFYVFTAMHGLHLLGGIAALSYVILRLGSGHRQVRRNLFRALAIYWHFMGVLWLYLLLVIWTRL
jgi:cytochrome c oxidase subunit III